jgi:hypothetical protein
MNAAINIIHNRNVTDDITLQYITLQLKQIVNISPKLPESVLFQLNALSELFSQRKNCQVYAMLYINNVFKYNAENECERITTQEECERITQNE